MLDIKLTWNAQFKYIVAKCEKDHKEHLVTIPDIVLMFYCSYIRFIFDYGSTLDDNACQTRLKKKGNNSEQVTLIPR